MAASNPRNNFGDSPHITRAAAANTAGSPIDKRFAPPFAKVGWLPLCIVTDGIYRQSKRLSTVEAPIKHQGVRIAHYYCRAEAQRSVKW